jgi:hypothetical protein
MWIAKLFRQFGIPQRPFLVRADSAGALDAIRSAAYTKFTKHIGIHLDFLRDRYQMEDLTFQHVAGKMNPADIFTKPLALDAFQKHRSAIGMMELPADRRQRSQS